VANSERIAGCFEFFVKNISESWIDLGNHRGLVSVPGSRDHDKVEHEKCKNGAESVSAELLLDWPVVPVDPFAAPPLTST
jgi:hypothetical protein